MFCFHFGRPKILYTLFRMYRYSHIEVVLAATSMCAFSVLDIAGQEREAMCVKIAVLVVVVSICGWTDAQDGEFTVSGVYKVGGGRAGQGYLRSYPNLE